MAPNAFPPGPTSLLFGFDLVSRVMRDPLTFYQEMHSKYGDVVYMKFGTIRDFTFFHPDAIHDLLTTKAKSFLRMKRQMAVFRQWNGNSLVVAEGADWLRQRRVLQPAFNTKRFDGYGREVVAATRGFLERSVPAQGVATIDFERAMVELTTEIICRTMFGTDLGSRLDEIRHAVATLTSTTYREMMRPFSWPDWLPLPSIRRKRAAIKTLDDLVRGFIRERRAENVDRGDLLSMMLFAVDAEADGRGLTDEEVRDNCMTIFLAGHDTTAAGLTWLGWFLASRPEYAARARDEVRREIGDRLPEYADLSRLTFLDQMIQETLRHRPSAIAVFGREASEDVELAGYRVPKGSLVHALSFTVHHDERWFPDPDRFDPERFSPERVGTIRPYAYFPFGIGPRMCIGSHFAKMEMLLVAATLLQFVELTPAPGQEEPIPRTDLTLRPQGGLRLDLRR